MLRFVSIPIPSNTLEVDAIETIIDIDSGTIEDITVTLPDGCVGLVHLQVYSHGVQIAPYNLTGSITGNNARISVLKDYPVTQPPYNVIVRAWNLDDTFDHTPTVEIMVGNEKIPTTLDLLKGL